MNAALFAAMLLLAVATGLNARRWFLTSVVAVTLALGACHVQTDNPPAPKLTDRGRVVSTVVAIDWLPDIEQVAKACALTNASGLLTITYACADVHLSNDGFTSTCTIYAVRPEDFNDTPKLVSLGHEFFHCLGARHAT